MLWVCDRDSRVESLPSSDKSIDRPSKSTTGFMATNLIQLFLHVPSTFENANKKKPSRHFKITLSQYIRIIKSDYFFRDRSNSTTITRRQYNCIVWLNLIINYMLERFSFFGAKQENKNLVCHCYCFELRCALSKIQGKVRNLHSTTELNIFQLNGSDGNKFGWIFFFATKAPIESIKKTIEHFSTIFLAPV